MADVFRMIAVTEISLSIGMLLAAMTHLTRYKVDPWHIIGMGLSYILFAGSALIEIQLRYGTPATWRTVYIVIAATVGLSAQTYTFIYWWMGKRWVRSDADS
jgi:hypothetical protein